MLVSVSLGLFGVLLFFTLAALFYVCTTELFRSRTARTTAFGRFVAYSMCLSFGGFQLFLGVDMTVMLFDTISLLHDGNLSSTFGLSVSLAGVRDALFAVLGCVSAVAGVSFISHYFHIQLRLLVSGESRTKSFIFIALGVT